MKKAFKHNFNLMESKEKIKINSTVDPIDYLHAWVKSEEREVEGFLEAIKQRDVLRMLRGKILEKQKIKAKSLDKIANGGFSLKTMFSSKKKTDELDAMEKEIANVLFLLIFFHKCDIFS